MTNPSLIELAGGEEELQRKIQAKYSKLAERGDLTTIQKLSRETGIEPAIADNYMAALYFSAASTYAGYSLPSLKQLLEWDKRAHEGKPLVFQNLDKATFAQFMQRGYNTTVRRPINLNNSEISELRSLTGVAPSRETVQEAVDEILKLENLTDMVHLADIERITGIKPNIPPAKIQQLYSETSKNARTFYWETIIRSTGIAPSEGTVQQAYKNLVDNNKGYEIPELVRVTGIKPAEETIQKAFQTLFKLDLREVQGLREATGIKPDEEKVMREYSKRLKEEYGVFSIKPLFEATGITPSEAIIQETYKQILLRGELDSYIDLQSTFKVAPSPDVKKVFDDFLPSK